MIWELGMDITRIFLFPLNLWCLHYKIGFSATHNHSILFYFSEQNCIKQKIASVNYFSLQEDPLIIQILSPPWRSWIVYLFRWKNIHIFRTSHYDAVFPNDTFYMKPVNNSWEWLFFFFFPCIELKAHSAEYFHFTTHEAAHIQATLAWKLSENFPPVIALPFVVTTRADMAEGFHDCVTSMTLQVNSRKYTNNKS